MSLELIESEVRRFLVGTEPEVLRITGRWGVGKTFAWKSWLTEAQTEPKGIGLKHYSYVSLFGITSLEELRFAIFENSVSTDGPLEPSLSTLKDNTLAVAKYFGRKAVWFGQQLPWIKGHFGGLGPIWFSSVQKTIVCFDDFERRGDRLTVRDVLGLVSQLKDAKHCKVLMILNEDGLSTTDREEFDKYLEKVIDTSLTFEPTPEESTRLVLNMQSGADLSLQRACISLGISNIRVIKRLQRAVMNIQP